MNSLDDGHAPILGNIMLWKVSILVGQAVNKCVNNFKQN